MLQRFLDPAVLAEISRLDLVAKTVVDGFVAGLHRSPDFGFSQEFAEYRPYTPGDDLRYVDWNVFARTERCYLKRYRGETNTRVTVLLDASASMTFGSHRVNKLDYARFLAAALCYLAHTQRDSTGVLVFDDQVRNYVAPSSRHGQLFRLLHALDKAEAGTRTDFAEPFLHMLNLQRHRGMVVVISDFYETPDRVIRLIEPLRYRGSDLVLFHVLDPEELRPSFHQPMLLEDMETRGTLEVSPDYARSDYRARIEAHVAHLRDKARAAGMDYYLLETTRPLDEALREYLTIRQGRL